MGKPSKRPPVPYHVLENIQAYMNANTAHTEGMPSQKWHSLLIVSLLERLNQRDPREAQYCEQVIAAIANLEAARFVTPDRIEEEIRLQFRNLIYGKPSRATHHIGTIQSQHGAVLDYLRQQKYPLHANHDKTREKWLETHWTRLMDVISIIPCPCIYTSRSLSFVEFIETVKRFTCEKKRQYRLHSQADTTDLIIANLHSTSPLNIERLLKAS